MVGMLTYSGTWLPACVQPSLVDKLSLGQYRLQNGVTEKQTGKLESSLAHMFGTDSDLS